MARAFISVGSNINAEENVRLALRRLCALTHLTGVSQFYRTAPWGRAGQPPFINGVVAVETELPPIEFKLTILRHIEVELGRIRGEDKFAARPIDLDLLLYDAVELASEELMLPDPEITSRPFLALPLAQLAPDLPLPGTHRCMREIAAAFQDADMQMLVDYTELLRKDIAQWIKKKSNDW